MRGFTNFLSAIFFVAALALLVSCGGTPTPVPATNGPMPVNKQFRLKAGLQYPYLLSRRLFTQYDDAIARVGDSLIVGSYKGKISISDTAKKQLHLLADLASEFLVDHMYVQLLGSDVIVFWQETDHEGSRSYVARFHRGSTKPIWKNKYSLPNLGQPVIDGDVAYVTARGLVARLQLSDGHPQWLCDTLYQTSKSTYLEFEKPRVYDSAVVFKEKVKNNQFRKADSIKLSATTGKVVN
jgi:hypothetical protein